MIILIFPVILVNVVIMLLFTKNVCCILNRMAHGNVPQYQGTLLKGNENHASMRAYGDVSENL